MLKRCIYPSNMVSRHEGVIELDPYIGSILLYQEENVQEMNSLYGSASAHLLREY